MLNKKDNTMKKIFLLITAALMTAGIASAQDITVKYNARTFTFGLQIVIE